MYSYLKIRILIFKKWRKHERREETTPGQDSGWLREQGNRQLDQIPTLTLWWQREMGFSSVFPQQKCENKTLCRLLSSFLRFISSSPDFPLSSDVLLSSASRILASPRWRRDVRRGTRMWQTSTSLSFPFYYGPNPGEKSHVQGRQLRKGRGKKRS